VIAGCGIQFQTDGVANLKAFPPMALVVSGHIEHLPRQSEENDVKERVGMLRLIRDECYKGEPDCRIWLR